jgi:hypothetical protein
MAVEPRDREAAQRWGAGAADYDRLREAQADSIEHLLVRIAVRPGERALDMATGTFADMLRVVRSHMPPPPDPAAPSPLEWGRPERVRELLGADFDLSFETGTSLLRLPSAEAAWEAYSRGAGPVKAALAHTDRMDDLRHDFIAFHEAFRTGLGIAVPRDYLVVIGFRR